MNAADERHDDDEIARLLRNAGERDRPDAAMQAEVRAAVEAEWRALVSAQERRRRVITYAAAAGVALAALGVWLTVPLLDRGPPSVATLALATGTVERRPDARARLGAARAGERDRGAGGDPYHRRVARRAGACLGHRAAARPGVATRLRARRRGLPARRSRVCRYGRHPATAHGCLRAAHRIRHRPPPRHAVRGARRR